MTGGNCLLPSTLLNHNMNILSFQVCCYCQPATEKCGWAGDPSQCAGDHVAEETGRKSQGKKKEPQKERSVQNILEVTYYY